MPEGGRAEGRNAVLEAYRSGKTVDKLYVQEHLMDGPIQTILREAKKTGTIVNYVTKDRLDAMTTTGHHQGVIAQVTAFSYADVDDMFRLAEERGSSLSSSFWMKSRIRTIWGRSSARPARRAPTASS